MVDLHTHILPGIDDGASNVLDSIEIIKRQQAQGVTQISLTPHFNIDNIELTDFLNSRQQAMDVLTQALESKKSDCDVELKLAAEVYLSPRLLNEDLTKLCIAKTNYLLVELPSNYYRPWISNVLYEITCANLIPIIAHIERYEYLQSNFEEILKMIDMGALVQANASSIVKHKTMQKLIFAFIKHNLIHCIASDTHSLYKRPPMLQEAYKLIGKKFGSDEVSILQGNSAKIFSGKDIVSYVPSLPKTFLGYVY